MRELEIINIESARREIEGSINRMREGYVSIAKEAVWLGYVLRRAEQNEVYATAGYKSISEFAEKEYGLNATATSRYMLMNGKYSIGGYSGELDEKFIAFDKSKLQEMLGLPSYIITELPPELTKAQIRDIVKEVKEEQQITPIEQAMEEPEKAAVELDTNLKKFIYEYFKAEPEKYVAVRKAEDDLKKIYRILAPSGVESLIARIAGTGRVMLSISGIDKPLKLVNVRTGEVEDVEWQQLVDSIYQIYGNESPEESFNKTYENNTFESSVNPPIVEAQEAAVEETSEEEEDVENEEETTDEEESVETISAVETVIIKDSQEVKELKQKLREEYNSLGEYIRTSRWGQIGYCLSEISEIVYKIKKCEKNESIPGQMSIEDMEAADEN